MHVIDCKPSLYVLHVTPCLQSSMLLSLHLRVKRALTFFLETLLGLNLFVITDKSYLRIEIRAIYDKLLFQYEKDENFIS